jgi:hypothetical protein
VPPRPESGTQRLGDIGIAMTASQVQARTGSAHQRAWHVRSLDAHTGRTCAGRIAGSMKASTGSGDIEAPKPPGARGMWVR